MTKNELEGFSRIYNLLVDFSDLQRFKYVLFVVFEGLGNFQAPPDLKKYPWNPLEGPPDLICPTYFQIWTVNQDSLFAT